MVTSKTWPSVFSQYLCLFFEIHIYLNNLNSDQDLHFYITIALQQFIQSGCLITDYSILDFQLFFSQIPRVGSPWVLVSGIRILCFNAKVKGLHEFYFFLFMQLRIILLICLEYCCFDALTVGFLIIFLHFDLCDLLVGMSIICCL